MRGVLGTAVGLAAAACTLTLAGCVVVVGNESKVQYAESAKSSHWRLGITLDRVDKATASQLGINRERTSMIASVVDGSPAERAGLKKYDIITRVNGSEEADVDDVLDAIRGARAGEEFKLTVLRGGQPVEVTAVLKD